MEIYTQDDVVSAWNLDEETLPQLLLTQQLLPAFEYAGIAQSDEDQSELEVSGVFYIESYEEALDSYIEIKKFCATSETRIVRPRGVDVSKFVFGGPNGFVPIKPILVRIKELVITEDEFARYSEETGLPDRFPRPKPETGPKEHQNLIALIGVLTELYVAGKPPSKPLRRQNGDLNMSAVVKQVEDHVATQGIDEVGLGGSTIRGKLVEGLRETKLRREDREQ